LQVSENGAGHRLLSSSSNRELEFKHGYIFNLCVSDTARRHGVATALMKEAVEVAKQMQLQILYVHVEANNNSALGLYSKLGYNVEEEEPLDVEMRYQRPRRILLSFRCQ
jgi:ribosomal protein S18 acetylase RimI-like enzyme